MKSHADEIWERSARFDVPMYEYAKGLEFALECISKGMKLNSDFTCAFCDSKKPHIHTAGEVVDFRKCRVEAIPIVEESFQGKHSHHNPCGKPFCVACYPSLKSEEVKSDGPC